MTNFSRHILIFLTFISFGINVFAQEQEQSVVVGDTVLSKKVRDTVHSPNRAALLSIAPGAGQIYNHLAMPKGKKKAFWKVPIIYAGLGATGYFAIKNGIDAQTLKNEYTFRSKNGIPNPALPEYANYDNQGILTLFEQKRTSRDLMIFAFIIVYGLNVLDAYTEAHFVNFDISKDLSMSFRPTLFDFQTPGIGLAFSFK